MKRKIVMLIMAGMLTVTSLAGCSSFKPEDVVATVEDQEITAEVANFYARYVQAQYETYYSAFLGANMWESEASEGKTYEESVKDSVLQTLEDMVLLEQHMKEYEVSISEAEEQVIKDSAKAFDEVMNNYISLEYKKYLVKLSKTGPQIHRQMPNPKPPDFRCRGDLCTFHNFPWKTLNHQSFFLTDPPEALLLTHKSISPLPTSTASPQSEHLL